MTCTDSKDQIIDYLYDELDPDARRTFEEHLAGCESCRAEVASLGGTLGSARVVLAAANEPPPAPVKAGAEKLAELVARRRGRPFRTLGAPIIPEDAGGIWALLRKPWFFPVFAATSVIGLFFVAQEAIVRRPITGQSPLAVPPPAEAPEAPRVLGPAVEPLAAPSAAAGAAAPAPESRSEGEPAPAPVEGPAKRRPRPAESAADDAHSGSGLYGLGAATTAGASGAKAGAPPPGHINRRVATPGPAREPADPFATGATRGADEAGRPAPSDPNVTQDPWRAREITRPAQGTYRSSAAPSAARPKNFANDVVHPFDSQESARSKPARAAAAAKPAAAPEPESADDGAVEAVESAAPMPAAAPAPTGGFAPGAAAASNRGRAESSESAQRAMLELGDRLLNEGRPGEAATVFRSLIARYPKHPDLPVWKARLEKAQKQAAE